MLDLKGYGWLLWEGVQLTVMVSVVSMAGAVIVGLLAPSTHGAPFQMALVAPMLRPRLAVAIATSMRRAAAARGAHGSPGPLAPA